MKNHKQLSFCGLNSNASRRRRCEIISPISWLSLIRVGQNGKYAETRLLEIYEQLCFALHNSTMLLPTARAFD